MHFYWVTVYNLAQLHNTATTQENQNDPPIPLSYMSLQLTNHFKHCSIWSDVADILWLVMDWK